jgi:uncharacterized protein with HEPN domain
MSSRRDLDRVQDIVDAIDEIADFTHNLAYEDFQSSSIVIRAVELNCIIIGEASSRLSEAFLNSHTDIPWHSMRGLRNKIVHDYFNVSPQILWETVCTDLPPIKSQMESILKTG